MEAHPPTIYFCEHCGDYFTRSDSCQRHRENRPPECLQVMREKADAKIRATQREHDEFIVRLERCLTWGEDIRKPLSRIVKNMYPESSKKRTREQGVESGPMDDLPAVVFCPFCCTVMIIYTLKNFLIHLKQVSRRRTSFTPSPIPILLAACLQPRT
jgi:hypothetical protein